jgi:hypothetical protein
VGHAKAGSKAKTKLKARYAVCVMSLKQAVAIQHRIGLSYRCRKSKSHMHVTQAEAKELVLKGDAEWHGSHHRVLAWVKHRIWAKTQCDRFGPTMQLVEPAEVYARRRRM